MTCHLCLLELVGVLTEKNCVRTEERWTVEQEPFIHSFIHQPFIE